MAQEPFKNLIIIGVGLKRFTEKQNQFLYFYESKYQPAMHQLQLKMSNSSLLYWDVYWTMNYNYGLIF